MKVRHAPFLIAAVLAAFFMGGSVRAEYGIMNVPVWCEIYPGVTESLDRDHQERVYGYGAAGGGYLVELYVSSTSDTWTLVQTDPERQQQCAIRSGRGWQFVIPSPPTGDSS